MQNNCVGCDIVGRKITPPGGIVYEDSFWIINHVLGTPNPLMKGLFIIQPIPHIENIDEVPIRQMEAFAPLLIGVSSVLRKELQPKRIYLCSFGEGVKHLHFLVLPRSADMPASGKLVLEEVIEKRLWLCTQQEAEIVAEHMKLQLEKITN